MKNGAKIAMIVLLVVTITLTALGITGVIEKKRQAEIPDWQKLQERKEETLATVAKAEADAQEGLDNIQQYIEHMEECKKILEVSGASGINPSEIAEYTKEVLASKNLDNAVIDKVESAVKKALTDETIDTESIEKSIKKAKDAKEKAEKELNGSNKLKDQAAKIIELFNVDESDTETASKNLNSIDKRVYNMNASLKRIAKVEITDTNSQETVVRRLYDEIVRKISQNFPDLDLGEAGTFSVEKELTAKKKKEAEVETGFLPFLKENFDYLFWLAGVALIATVLCFLGWKRPEDLKKVGKTANKNMMLVALVVITLFFFVMTRYKNLTPANIYNVINQYSYIIILATGMLLCIVSSANIDLSVGRVMGFIAACAAKFVMDAKMPVGLSMALCLLIGIAIGAWQGFWIAYVKIPAFVVTLAGQLTFYGLTMVLLKGETKAPFPENFNNVFGNAIPDFLGSGNGGLNVTALVIGAVVILAFIAIQLLGRANRVKKGYSVDPIGLTIGKIVTISAVLAWMFYSLAQNKGLPTILITVSLVLLIYTFLTSKTVIGRHLYAMGGNVNAARLSGVKTQRMLFLVYVNMGLLAALAGLAYAVRMNSASPMGGQGEELNAIAACYIGGASAYGGIGTVGGAVIGALTMGMIKNGMSMMGMNQDVQQVVLGLVLLLAVVIDIVSKSSGTSLPFLSKLSARKERKAEKAAVKV